MKKFLRRPLLGQLVAMLIVASTAHAQNDGASGLARAVLALDNGPDGPIRVINGRLFGALIDARIIDRNNNPGDFADVDEVVFTISRGQESLPFSQEVRTRVAFEQWARENSAELLRLIFPGSVSAATLGRDAAQVYAQQLLFTTVLELGEVREPGSPRRQGAGGLVEFEWFGRDDSLPGDSGRAWQGMYALGRFASVQGRYARTQESLSTQAWSASFDYHPYFEIEKDVIVRIGGTARTGFLYSHSQTVGAAESINLGTVDFSGGGWASVRKNFRRFRVGGGTLFQGTRSVVPLDDSHLSYLTDVIAERGISWDLMYGGTLAFDTSASTAVIGKYLESRSVHADFDRPPFHLALIGYSFTLGPGSALDAGYKWASSAGTHAGGVFVQGHFGW